MIYARKTDEGGFAFGFIETEDDLRDLYRQLGNILRDDEDDDEVDEEDEEVDEEDEEVDEDIDDDEFVPPEELECDHQITIGYDDDGYVGYVTFDPPKGEHSVACALLRAAASQWPIHYPADKALKHALGEIAGMRAQLDGDDVDTGE